VPVHLTAYCLQGTTRRDHLVRHGIVAADPKLFPLGRYLEVYVGRKYFGRFLIDDTGSKIRDGILDIWTPSCREARLFGRQRGTAVLVPRPRGAHQDTLLTGRLGGPATR
jgi:3D (Asp-Asp-Asp) domain-containing protein